ncbi:MAG: hypothetical protein JWO94_3382, partial [Verrucomicrobiaceae bacterium]|nr:hypothetical protein [Verrucomicrobiaceae bacterium]
MTPRCTVLCVVSWLVVSTGLLQADTFIVPGRRIGNLRLGPDGKAEMKALGPPASAEDEGMMKHDYVWHTKKDGKEHTLRVHTVSNGALDAKPRDGETIRSVRVTSPVFHTESGVTTGWGFKDIHAKFPHAGDPENPDPGIRFEFDGDSKCIAITVVPLEDGKAPSAPPPAPEIKLPAGFKEVEKAASPDGKLSVFAPNYDEVDDNKPAQNYLVETASHRIIATLKGAAAAFRESHTSMAATWSEDGSILVWGVYGKWSFRTLVVVKLEGDTVLWQADLLSLAQKEILARTRAAAPKLYAAKKGDNSGNGSDYPEGFTVAVWIADGPLQGYAEQSDVTFSRFPIPFRAA